MEEEETRENKRESKKNYMIKNLNSGGYFFYRIESVIFKK